MKLTTNLLMKSAVEIKRLMKANVTAIEFEDGSGNKYNYQLEGKPEWKFIDIGPYWAANTAMEVGALEEAIKTNNISLFRAMLSRVIHSYNSTIGKYHDELMKIQSNIGRDAVIDELFNGD